VLGGGRRGPNNPEDGSSPTADPMQDLEKQHRAQLLRLGAVALEMHQRGEIDGDDLMRLAADAAKAEEELRLARNR
jgi:hypothetical protein